VLLLALAAVLGAPIAVGAETRLASNTVTETGAGNTTMSSLTSDLWASTGFGRFSFGLHYSPQLSVTTAPGSTVLPFQTAALTGTFSTGGTSFNTGVSAGYGQRDFGPLAQAAAQAQQPGTTGATGSSGSSGPTIDRLPSSRFLDVFVSSARFSVGQQLARGLSLDWTSGVGSSTGLGHDAKAQLPLVRTVTSTLGAFYQLSKADTFSLGTGASYSVSSLGHEATSGDVGTAWKHRFNNQTSMDLGVGVARVLNGDTATATAGPVVGSWLPTFHAALTQAFLLQGRPFSLKLDAQAQPAVDPLGTGGYLRASSGLTGSWSPEHWLALSARVGGARAVGGALDGAWGATSDFTAGIRLDRDLTLSVGAQAALSPPAGTTTISGPGNVWLWGASATLSWVVRGRL
jgi:hypothetical protein